MSTVPQKITAASLLTAFLPLFCPVPFHAARRSFPQSSFVSIAVRRNTPNALLELSPHGGTLRKALLELSPHGGNLHKIPLELSPHGEILFKTPLGLAPSAAYNIKT